MIHFNVYTGRILTYCTLLFIFGCAVNLYGQNNITYPEKDYIRTDGLLIYDTGYIRSLIRTGKAAGLKHADSAIPVFENVLYASVVSDYVSGVNAAVYHLGDLYEKTAMYEKCLFVFNNLLSYCSGNAGLQTALPSIHNGIANIHRTYGNYEMASDHYYKALAIAKKQGTTDWSASIYNNMGSVLIPLEQYDQAMFYLNKAEMLADKKQAYEALGFASMNKGLIYMKWQQWDSSFHFFTKALHIGRAHDLTQLIYLTLTNLGDMYLSKSEPDKAIVYLQQTNKVAGEIFPYYHAAALHLTGKAYLANHKYELAKEYLERAMLIARQYGLNENAVTTYGTLADLHAAGGHYRKAFQQMSAYTRLKDSLAGQMVKNNISLLDIRYRTAERERDIALKELHINKQQQRLERKNIWIAGSITGVFVLGVMLIGAYHSHQQTKRYQSSKIQMLQQEREIAMLKAMVKGEEKERTRMARELHDGIVSQLLAVTLNMDSIYKSGNGVMARGELEDVLHQLKDATAELRKTAHNLLPGLLLENGLASTVAALCSKTEKNTRIAVRFQEYGIIPRLEPDIELSLYRIIQELVQNVLKHASASRLLVQLSCRNGLLSITVEDNGSGFPADQIIQEGKTGLSDIRQRIMSMNGIMEIHSGGGHDQGTAIYIELPVAEEPAVISERNVSF